MGGWRTGILIAILAAAAGLGAGYWRWGWPVDWYAGHDAAALPAGTDDPVRYGWQLVISTPEHIGRNAAAPAMRYAGNDLACTNCHLNAGRQAYAAPFISTFTSFPMISDDRYLTLADRINGCMTRSMNGRPLPGDSREMEAFIAYIRFVGQGSPSDIRIPGMGLRPLPAPKQAPDATRGRTVYAANCARCHGPEGAGSRLEPPRIGYAAPPLWGEDSFNGAAGMADMRIAAAFVRANMPFETTYDDPSLNDQQAWDVAAFVTTQPRPAGPQHTP